MILFYSGMAFLFFIFTLLPWVRCGRLHEEIDCIKYRITRLEEKTGHGYKPLLTLQEQIAEELHILTRD